MGLRLCLRWGVNLVGTEGKSDAWVGVRKWVGRMSRGRGGDV